MILKLLIFVIAAVFVYKFFGGRFPRIKKPKNQKKLDEDTLVECKKCATYVTLKESIVLKGKHYCSQECAE